MTSTYTQRPCILWATARIRLARNIPPYASLTRFLILTFCLRGNAEKTRGRHSVTSLNTRLVCAATGKTVMARLMPIEQVRTVETLRAFGAFMRAGILVALQMAIQVVCSLVCTSAEAAAVCMADLHRR